MTDEQEVEETEDDGVVQHFNPLTGCWEDGPEPDEPEVQIAPVTVDVQDGELGSADVVVADDA